jgi:UDP-N-acetylmuramyl tripeptide synthase
VATRIDSRRLPGANLFDAGGGAILDVRLEGEDPAAVVEAWAASVRRVLHAVGWDRERTAWRRSGDDLSLFLTAPGDALYAATEVSELAWEVASGAPERDVEPALDDVRRAIAEEQSPAWRALRHEAARRGVAFIADAREVTVGMGAGGVTFPAGEIPPPERVAWDRIHDVPVVMVTGTNGKSTTVRLLGAIVAAAGQVPGISTTDGLKVGADAIGSGDYSGPEGARRILRDRRVEAAVLETARGGIQRRGLVVPQVDAAAITNVAEDHLGEFGIHGLDDIADLKMVVARAIKPGGTLVLNADDAILRARAPAATAAHVAWFSLRDAGRLLDVASIPVTFGGAARHNVANAMAAALLARALGIDDETVARGLAAFRNRPEDNPGRLNLIALGGATLLIDYAHNPHGMDALVAVARELPAKRRLLLIGQAGDRDDAAIRALARAGWALRPDAVVIKEMADFLRGRSPGEIPAVLEAELLRLGADSGRIVRAPSEIEGVRAALRWAREGDLLVLPTHAERREVLELIDTLGRKRWRAGTPVP